MEKKLVSMKLSKVDAKKLMGGSIASGDDRPQYPYGLQLSLDTEALKKLGMDGDLPDIGKNYTMTATCDVVSVSSNASEGGENQNVSIQITDLAFSDDDDDDDAPTTKLYGKAKA